MSKKAGSRFDGLFGSVRKPEPDSPNHPDAQASKHLDIQTSESQKAKSKDPDYIRTTVYLPKSLHKRLKNFAIDQDSEMSEVMIQSVEAYLVSKHSDV